MTAINFVQNYVCMRTAIAVCKLQCFTSHKLTVRNMNEIPVFVQSSKLSNIT